MSIAENKKIQDSIERLSAFSQREKWLLIITIIALFLFLFLFTVYQPLDKKNNRIQQEIVDKNIELTSLNSQVEILKVKASESPNEVLKTKINLSKSRLKHLENEIEDSTTKLISPYDMEKLIKSLIAKQSNMQLLAFEKYAPEKIAIEKDSEIFLYKHSMRVLVATKFSSMQKYIAALDTISHKIFWQNFNYSVEQYPHAKLEIELYTLSHKKGFNYD